MRKHEAEMLLFAKNEDAVVWYKDRERNKKWKVTCRPGWLDHYDYKVVLPSHEHIWQWYLDGETIQVLNLDVWKVMEPGLLLDLDPEVYRIKPVEPIEGWVNVFSDTYARYYFHLSKKQALRAAEGNADYIKTIKVKEVAE